MLDSTGQKNLECNDAHSLVQSNYLQVSSRWTIDDGVYQKSHLQYNFTLADRRKLRRGGPTWSWASCDWPVSFPGDFRAPQEHGVTSQATTACLLP